LPQQEVTHVPLKDLERRMRPGIFSQSGFLGPTESLRTVLESDAATLDQLGLAAETLALRLRACLTAALAIHRATTIVSPHIIRIQGYKGPQICPFAPEPHENPCPGPPPSDNQFASIDWSIQNTRNNAHLTGPGLIVHLIHAHHFFEGPQSPYRVDPRALAHLLGLGPYAT
jgi:hypothetical protein